MCKCIVEWQCATLRKTGRTVQSLLCAHQVEGVLTIIKNLSVTYLTCLATSSRSVDDIDGTHVTVYSIVYGKSTEVYSIRRYLAQDTDQVH